MRNWIVIGVVIIFVLSGASLLYPYFKDMDLNQTAIIQEQRLALEKVSMQNTDNAFSDFSKLDKEKDLVLVSGAGFRVMSDPGKFSEFYPQKAQEALKNNPKIIQTALIASNRKYYQNSLTSDPANFKYMTDSEEVPKEWDTETLVRSGGDLLIINGLNSAQKGFSEDSIDSYIAAAKLGTLILNSQPSTIEYLHGLAIRTNALKAIQQLTANANLNSEQKSYIKKQLTQNEVTAKGLQNIIKGEYQITKDQLAKLASNSISIQEVNPDDSSKLTFKPYHFSNNLTADLARDSYDNLLKNSSNPCEPIMFDSPISGIGLIFKRNSLGKTMINLRISIFENIFSRTCEQQTLTTNILNN